MTPGVTVDFTGVSAGDPTFTGATVGLLVAGFAGAALECALHFLQMPASNAHPVQPAEEQRVMEISGRLRTRNASNQKLHTYKPKPNH